MSGNGKQVQLAPGQSRYALVARPHTPQRADAFTVPTAGVGGSYVQGVGGHLQARGGPGLPQPPTPPQQELKQQPMSYGQAGVRPQQNYPYRGGPPQSQQMQRPAHHRQPTGWTNPGQAPQVVFSMGPMYLSQHVPHGLPPAAYPQQPAPRAQYFQQPASMPTMMQPQHYFGSYSGQQGQQQYMYSPPPGQPMGGAGRAQPALSQQSLQQPPQQPQQHSMMGPTRYPPMQHVPPATNEKKRRSRAIAIVDPKSGKDVTDEILEEDSHDTNSEAGDRAAAQPDENSLAVVKEFARRVTDAANAKDPEDNIAEQKVEAESEGQVSQSCENNLTMQQSLEEVVIENKSEPDISEDKVFKHNQITELSETPVVSAISNSPEIVPKQSHINLKLKQSDCSIPELKKMPVIKNSKLKSNLSDIIIDDMPTEPKELSKETPIESRQLTKQNEEIISNIEEKPIEVPSLVENEIHSTQTTVVNKSKLGYVNSQQTDQKIDTFLYPFSKAPLQQNVSNNQETETSQNPQSNQKIKNDSKKNKTRLNNSERVTSQIKGSEMEHSVDVKPLAPVNNSLSEEQNPPLKELTELKRKSPVPVTLNTKVCEKNPSFDKMRDIIECTPEEKTIEGKLEELHISAVTKKEINSDSFTDVSAPAQEKEIPKETAEKVREAECVPASETNKCEKDPEVNVENSHEQCDTSPITQEQGEPPNDDQKDKSKVDKVAVPLLRYNYKDDQWSPLNTSGKRCYDTEFLLMLRNDPNSKKKPENINQLEIMADATRQLRNTSDVSRSVSMMRQNDLLPGFARSATHSATPNRKSQHGKPNSKGISTPGSGLNNRPNIIHVNLSLRSDVKLNETQNAWKPARMRSTKMEEEEVVTLELYKTFRSVLNKLTPQNFDTLIAKVRKLNIDTKERLTGVINLVFEKAVDEPNFSVAYALMCKELEQLNVHDDKEEKQVNFRNLIVGRCQSEFEKEDNTTAIRKEEIDECTDPEKKKELILNLEEEERKIRRRSVGNVRFIGELFKQNIIVSNIILHCMNRLLKKIEEETLECLCKLLSTIGKDLEKKCSLDLQSYFNSMKEIVEMKDNKVSSRVRFMLQDVIDLRLNHWIPRQQAANANPKTMDQIKLEVELEQKNAMYSNFSSPANNPGRKDDRPNNMNKRGGSKSVTEDGWSPVPSRNARSKQAMYSVDPGKLIKMLPLTPITQTSLQPSTVSTWGKGSTVTNKKSDQWSSSHKSGTNAPNNSRKPTTETSNIFMALDNQYSEGSSTGQSEVASGRKVSYRSKGASIERSTFKSDSEEQTTGSSQETISNKIKDLMLHVDSPYGILDKIQTDFTKDEMPLMVKELILWGLEYNKIDNMRVIGDVTGRLVDDDNLTKEEFLGVVKQTMEHSSSYFTKDGDHVWKMLSAFIWAHMKKDALSLKEIHSAFSKVMEVEKGFKLLTAIFLEKLKDSQDHIKTLWEKSNMELSEWMSQESVEQFLEEFPLKWLRSKGVLTQEEACTQMLLKMQANESRDSIKEWIDQRIGEGVQEGWFIRAITEAIHTYALFPLGYEKPRFVDTETSARLAAYCPLLVTYVACQEKRELECLFAIQHLIRKLEYPQGIALKVFEYIWENGEIISQDGFVSWEKNTDPHEQEGKGVILKMLTSFFTHLKSMEESSDENDEY